MFLFLFPYFFFLFYFVRGELRGEQFLGRNLEKKNDESRILKGKHFAISF